MRSRTFYLAVVFLAIPLLAHSAYADSISLGNAAPFAVLGGSAVKNTGASVITAGDVGVNPGGPVGGFPPGIVDAPGAILGANATTLAAQNALVTLYTTLAGEAPIQNLTGQDLGGLTLTPGVYKFDSSAQLTGKLTLNALGDSNAVWVFQIGSTLTTASASSVVIENEGPNGNNGLFWQVGSSATLGTTTDFEGNIVALTSITLNTGATDDCGRLLARNGAVSLDTNTIGIGCTASDVTGEEGSESGSGGLSGGGSSSGGGVAPEPGTLLLAACGILALLALRRKI